MAKIKENGGKLKKIAGNKKFQEKKIGRKERNWQVTEGNGRD